MPRGCIDDELQISLLSKGKCQLLINAFKDFNYVYYVIYFLYMQNKNLVKKLKYYQKMHIVLYVLGQIKSIC